MKSIKPGRGPSFMGGIVSIGAILFAVGWIFMAISMGAPIFFPLFGVFFIVMAIANAIYYFTNATAKNRFSEFDITDDGEEHDPLNERFYAQNGGYDPSDSNVNGAFCPYCGADVKTDFTFCMRCGKKLP